MAKQLLFILFLALSLNTLAKPSTCAKLREQQKICERGFIEEKGEKYDVYTADVICGGNYHTYWAPEAKLYSSSDYLDEAEAGVCVLVVEEAFKVSCDVLKDYKIPALFCKNKKKEICAQLKSEGFGSVALLWHRDKVSREYERGKDLYKTLVRRPCREVLK